MPVSIRRLNLAGQVGHIIQGALQSRYLRPVKQELGPCVMAKEGAICWVNVFFWGLVMVIVSWGEGYSVYVGPSNGHATW